MPLDKIAKFIQEHGVRTFKYHTWRTLEQGKGELRILVLEDNVARTEYLCPKCGHHGYVEQEWKRPFTTKCEKCAAKITVPKMRQQIKREMKKGQPEEGDEE